MDNIRLKERVNDYLKALTQLEKAVQAPKNEFTRDAVIQRFEFTYELAWKMLKLSLEKEGIIARSPRETLQEALQTGFIADGNAWSELQQKRNLTTHTYDEGLAEEVYQYIHDFGLILFQHLAEETKKWQI